MKGLALLYLRNVMLHEGFGAIARTNSCPRHKLMLEEL